MKCKINIDERWPIYFIDESYQGGLQVQLNEEFYKEFIEISKKYEEYQERMALIYDEQERIDDESGLIFPEGTAFIKEYECDSFVSKFT